MKFPRASGILLHPVSLPSEFGIGDFGRNAFEFVDFLAETEQAYWQILPLGPTGYGDSPYQSFSAFAGNTNLISPQTLVEEELLETDEIIQKPDFTGQRIDYGKVYDWKKEVLHQAFQNFKTIKRGEIVEDFENFSQESAFWLNDYALFRAIRAAQDHKAWFEWEKPLKFREKRALEEAQKKLQDEILEQQFYQFLFFRQWFALKSYANEKKIKIIGDIPIFVALDSADVWHNPKEFKLNKDGTPKVVSGVPPDYFSKTGQLWGNPIYDWEKMRDDGFRWWLERVRFTLQTVDVIRIDHFRGFAACWEVPGGDKTAENGEWVEVPGERLFNALKNGLGDLPLIAEDLGVITPDVKELRDSFGFPGMKILQYAFGGDAQNDYLPHNFPRNCVVYTGTHDNDTSNGWFESANAHERDFCRRYLKTDGERVHWDFIRAAFSSVADTAIVPLQDVLGLGNEARMNLPATDSGNWNWRFRPDDITEETVTILRELTRIFGRSS